MPDLQDEDVDKIMKQAMLAHLSDDEMGEYHDEAIDDFGRARVKAHLRRCLICSRKYERMQFILADAPKTQVPEENQKQLQSLITKTLPPQALVAALRALIGFVLLRQVKRRGARAAGERKVQDWENEDGSLGYQIVDDEESGDLIVDFDSNRPDFEGCQVIIKAGSLTKTIILKCLGEGLPCGQVRITRKEREKLVDDAELLIENIIAPETTSL